MEKNLRKYRNNLVVTGTGAILFGLWTVVKLNMSILLFPDILGALPTAAREVGMPESALWITMAVILVIAISIILGARLFIGINAIAEGKGKKRGYTYLILAAILLFSNLKSMPDLFVAQLKEDVGLIDAIITILVELTSLYNLSDLLYYGVRIKLLNRKQKEG